MFYVCCLSFVVSVGCVCNMFRFFLFFFVSSVRGWVFVVYIVFVVFGLLVVMCLLVVCCVSVCVSCLLHGCGLSSAFSCSLFVVCCLFVVVCGVVCVGRCFWFVV